MRRTKADFQTVLSWAISILLSAALIIILLTGIGRFSGQADQRGAETLRNSLYRACVQCYAIEGRYPPSVEYLEDNYGIQINRDCYHVFYNGFASNVMPEITVMLADAEE